MTNKDSNRIIVFCNSDINNHEKKDSKFDSNSNTNHIQINDKEISGISTGTFNVKNLKLNNCTFSIRTSIDDQSLGNSLRQNMHIEDCTFSQNKKIQVYLIVIRLMKM
ncbi:hypothetical protein EDI_259130 [Entamoeba dispar SAW760]|uniref:Uncharacterized protein n=1 Tax=Entamoeba dispar (strain ATCC PRA-260 / SAW760) TaxID=370354 RepID=B0EMR0_ENTDS|nr:uncharacterized protein EDI_259130 [Entamoeba dispar SAW760]EDR24186.1 hypothetical protein EDI_259130 [Entamoeba dispar SAW760]|eukprot:EDR24186.1 hypothetical protein EDI_259130 [Entamoeba dispar SAW760]